MWDACSTVWGGDADSERFSEEIKKALAEIVEIIITNWNDEQKAILAQWITSKV